MPRAIARGWRIVTVTGARPRLFETDEWRVEGRDKVSGAARYTADVKLPGMLHAAFVSSPFPHARVIRVDTAAARALPGVHAIVTGADTKPARFGRRLLDWPVLCWDRVLFIGDRVAAVAAESPEIAEAAARAVEVEYEELPAVFDPDAALAKGAPLLHPEADTYRMLGTDRQPVPHPNVQGHQLHEHGDVAAGFASAAHVFEHAFETARIHQGYIEPHASVVWLERETVHVVTTNKAPFALRDQMAAALGIPAEQIVIDAGHIGGDFGGKGLSLDEYALYYLARASGRPVRYVARYSDELQVASVRHASRITLRTGIDAAGRIVAHESRVVFNGGAYAAGKPVAHLMPGDAMLTLAGYGVPNARVEATTVYTNTLPAGHARAPGQPQNAFAAESHMDLIARELGVDPLEFRQRNAIRAGETDVEGAVAHESCVPEVLATLRRESPWDSELPPDHGRGVALGVRHVGRGKTSLRLTLHADGHVEVLTAVSDQGGGAHTMIQRIVAAELGLGPERVVIRRGTTEETPTDPGVGGSRVTSVHGGAALDGARKLVLAAASRQERPLTVTGEHEAAEHVYSAYAYAVEVAVDRDTGAVRVTDALLVADVGTVINPVALRGQLEGGFVYGLGETLMEELRVEDGRVTTVNLGDYKLPTIADTPPFRLVLLTEATGPGPFGAKSVGELANPGIGPAVANAIHAAAGVRITRLPITAENVFKELSR